MGGMCLPSLESTLERLSLQNFDELRNDQSTSEAKSNRAKQRSIDLYPQFEQHKKDVFPSLRKELYEEDRLLTDRLFPVGDELTDKEKKYLVDSFLDSARRQMPARLKDKMKVSKPINSNEGLTIILVARK